MCPRCGFLYCRSVFGTLVPVYQGQILAVWILAAKLPNSDLNFAVDFWVDFFVLFFPRKKARKNPPKNPPQNSPRTLFGKIPIGFLQKPFLDGLWYRRSVFCTLFPPKPPFCQGGPNPVFLNPVFQGSSCSHCAALHGLLWLENCMISQSFEPSRGGAAKVCRSCSELLKQKNRV